MRETPGFEHLEYWCREMTLGGEIAEADVDELNRRAALEDREAQRLVRVAQKATKPARRQRRYLNAARAKARQVYCQQLAAAMRSTGADVVGDLSYLIGHTVLATANAFGNAWLQRRVAH